jgi:hypothetical protein
MSKFKKKLIDRVAKIAAIATYQYMPKSMSFITPSVPVYKSCAYS